ncbi:hypothetical protein LPJ55_000840 [Coemansia sp. RSA 990]|nr:hypothetical protein LPJ55_000840 [Coemansia sp. RSA 990]
MRSASSTGGSSKGELHAGEDAALNRTHDETGDSITDNASMIQDHDDDDNDDEDEEDSNKQQRLMRACDNCRRKKVKCNGTKPSCSHCMRMKLTCNYSPLVRKKRTRRSVIDKLQDRLASMEQMLQPLVERLQPNDPVVSAGVGGFGLGFGFAPAPPPTLVHPLGLPAPPKSYTSQGNSREMQSAPPSAASDPPPLPPPHIVEELMEIAITRMTPTAPPVSWTRLVRRLHSGQLPEFIICATIALAARFSNRPEFSCTPRYNAGREYAKRAAELVSGLVDKPDPDVVFCLVMLSLYEWGCGRGESAWTYTGMATRLAQRCRLHLVDEEDFNENVDEQAYTWANAEWRRRLWWHVYCGDRTSVIVASRPATVHDDDCVVNLPTHDHEWITGTVPSVDPRSEPASLGNDAHLAGQSSQHKPMPGNRLPDSWWLVVELYRMCSRISEFANRRRLPVRSSNIPRRQMFDILDRELEDIRSRFLPCMEFPPRTEWLLCGYANMGDGAHGMSNICAIFFNIYLMYYAAKIILYRSELPEYQHESISPDLIERAKSVCIESAHKQADVIRWALDNVPVEEWDPKVGVWSLQGASIHVNAALVADNAIAEQSRRDLEVHLKLHVASDQYYHFNMAMVTMLHHVFNLRKQQRLAARSHSSQSSEIAPSGSRIVIQHANDSDPWIVPRCSSFLGFTYNYSQLRGILNTAIKQTTYSPPDAITEGGVLPPDNSQAGYPQPISSLSSAAQATAISIGSSVPQLGTHRQQSANFNVDLSGGLWSLPSNLDSASLANAMSAYPEMAKLASLHLDTASSNDTNPPLSATSVGNSNEESLKSAKRSYGSASGPGNRKASAGKPKADGTTEAQQLQQLQRLEDLRARVVLLQQLSGKQNGPADALSSSSVTNSAAGLHPDSQTAGSQDVNGFLSNFAESIGSVASQLGSSGPMPWPKSESPANTSVPSNGGSQQVRVSNADLAAAYGQQQGLISDAWLAGSSSAVDFSAISASLAGASTSISNEDLQRIAAQVSLAGQAATPGYVSNTGAQQPADYSVESIHDLMHNPAAFHPAGSDTQ